MDQQPQSSQGALSLQATNQIVRYGDPLHGRSQNELTGMEDEGLVSRDLHQLGQVFHWLLNVDVRVARVGEDSEVPSDTKVDRRGLDGVAAQGLDNKPT